MRKVMGILMALCLLTVFVSSASAGIYHPKLITIPFQHDGDIDITYGTGSAYSVSSAQAGSYYYPADCPEAFHQDIAGVTESGFYSQGIATASPSGVVSSYGDASIEAYIH
jgi:hypothetical protein